MGFRNPKIVRKVMISILVVASLLSSPSKIVTSIDREPNLSIEHQDLVNNQILNDKHDVDIVPISYPEVQPQQPVQEVVEEQKIEKWIDIRATAYTANCKGCSGRTKTEYDVRHTIKYKGMGIISVDPKVIPLGSVVEIDGMGLYKALDTGGAIQGKKVDVLVKTYNEAMEFGVKHVKLRIIDDGGS